MENNSSSLNLLFVDDDQNSDLVLEVSDEKYAEELQFQEALVASTMAMAAVIENVDVSSSLASTSSLPVTVFVTPSTPTMENPSEKECREESLPLLESSSLSFCEICVEKKETDQMFKNERCVHSFCSDCIFKYVATKIDETPTGAISCPCVDCKSFIELENCREMLPTKLVERWDEALFESLIMASEKVYCPFNDCSAVMIVEDDEEGVIMESECPICHRLFCGECQVPWHPGIECEEYKRLNEDEKGRDDLLMRELAHEKKWMKCPQCKFFVEKNEGCRHITCRCSFEFCYDCGSSWSNDHSGCQLN